MDFKNSVSVTGFVTSEGGGGFVCAVGRTYVDRRSRTVAELSRIRVVTATGAPTDVRRGSYVSVRGRLYPSPSGSEDFLVRAHSIRVNRGAEVRLRADADLCGYIAALDIRSVGSRIKAELRLATREPGSDGKAETTVHSVCAWVGKGVLRPSELRKGLFVRVTGSLSGRLDYGRDFEPVILDEVVASKIESERGRL